MEEWLENYNILIDSKQNEVKSVIAERFVKTFKAKIYQKMTAIDTKSYLPYLNKLVDQCINTYHHSIHKNAINADYSASTEKIETNPKDPKFKVNDGVRITKYKNNFSKSYTENWPRKSFVTNSVSKTIPWKYKIKDLNGEKIIGSFYEKELLLSIS